MLCVGTELNYCFKNTFEKLRVEQQLGNYQLYLSTDRRGVICKVM
jgi:hypothetical protein